MTHHPAIERLRPAPLAFSSWVGDARAAITIDYDLAGNRTHIHTHVNDIVGSESDSIYQYDAMNRQKAIDTVEVANGVASFESHRLTYNANANANGNGNGNGNRKSDTHNGSTET